MCVRMTQRESVVAEPCLVDTGAAVELNSLLVVLLLLAVVHLEPTCSLSYHSVLS